MSLAACETTTLSPIQWKRTRPCRSKTHACKRVQFGPAESSVPRVEVLFVFERHDNVLELWWTEEELAEIMREAEVLAHLTDASTTCQQQKGSPAAAAAAKAALRNDSIRGLEGKTETGAWDRFLLLRDSQNAVLGAQEKHVKAHKQLFRRSSHGRASSSNNSTATAMAAAVAKAETELRQAIATAYLDVSHPARRAAYVKGLIDQKEAARIHEKAAAEVAGGESSSSLSIEIPKSPIPTTRRTKRRPTLDEAIVPPLVLEDDPCSPVSVKDKVQFVPVVMSLPSLDDDVDSSPVPKSTISNNGPRRPSIVADNVSNTLLNPDEMAPRLSRSTSNSSSSQKMKTAKEHGEQSDLRHATDKSTSDPADLEAPKKVLKKKKRVVADGDSAVITGSVKDDVAMVKPKRTSSKTSKSSPKRAVAPCDQASATSSLSSLRPANVAVVHDSTSSITMDLSKSKEPTIGVAVAPSPRRRMSYSVENTKVPVAVPYRRMSCHSVLDKSVNDSSLSPSSLSSVAVAVAVAAAPRVTKRAVSATATLGHRDSLKSSKNDSMRATTVTTEATTTTSSSLLRPAIEGVCA